MLENEIFAEKDQGRTRYHISIVKDSDEEKSKISQFNILASHSRIKLNVMK